MFIIGIISSSLKALLTPLLDLYPNAAAAYSLRKLRTTYSGSAIRVRRDFDNTEQDIGFDGSGNLNTATLQSFVGYFNTYLYSERLDVPQYFKTNITISTDVTTAPDGANTADAMFETVTNGQHALQPNYNFTVDQTTQNYTYSVYVKANGRTTGAINVFFNQGLFPYYGVQFDLSAVTVTPYNLGTGILVNSGIQSVGNGWYRVYCTGRTTQNGVHKTTLSITSSAGVFSYTGDITKGIYAWGNQFTIGNLQPYQVTTASARFGNGFVTTWYDQSGNGRNAVQATAANQPRIVNAGVVDTLNGKPSVYLPLSSSQLVSTLNSSTILNGDFSYFVLFNRAANTTNAQVVGTGGSAVNGTWRALYLNSGFSYQITFSGYAADVASSINSVIGINYLININKNGTSVSIKVNNNTASTGTPSLTSITSTNFYIGKPNLAGLDSMVGYLPEIIIYPSNQNSNITGINSNINSYYTIY